MVRIMFTRSVLVMALAGICFVGMAGAHAQPRAGVPPVTPADPAAELTFFVGLPYDSRGLEREARAISDPSSPRFREYSTVAETSARFGASEQSIANLDAAARSLGLRSQADPTRLFARVTGTVAAWEKAIGQKVQFTPAAVNALLSGSANDSYAFSPTQQMIVISGVPLPTIAATVDPPAFTPAPAALRKASTWFLPAFDRYVPAADTPPGMGAGSASAGARPQVLLFPGSDGSSLPGNTGTPVGVSCVANGSTAVLGDPALRGAQGQSMFFTPDQLSTAYGLTRLQARHGSSTAGDVAIISLNGGFLDSDLQTAANCFGHRAPKVEVRLGTGVGQKFVNVSGETALDLQTVSWVLKKAKSVRMVQVTNGSTSFLDGYSRALTDPQGPPRAISLSYGGCEQGSTAQPGLRAQESLFQLAAIVGTSLFVATGDTGSSACQMTDVLDFVGLTNSLSQAVGTFPAPVAQYLTQMEAALRIQAASGAPTVGYPASSPWVTAVGGTQLTLGEKNRVVGEVVWNDLQYGQEGNTVGTGGVSAVFKSPWYQSPNTARDPRIVPDVSALAAVSPGTVIFLNGVAQIMGGTSQASPLTAAGSALVSESLTSRGEAPLGFVNPWLYQEKTAQSRVITDVTAGNNQYPVPYAPGSVNVPACCQATRGFDSASGLGSLRFDAFAAQAAH